MATYDSLLADIQTYAEHSSASFVAQIPSFIELAENKITLENKPLGFKRVVTGTITSSTLTKPIRWRRTRSFSVTAAGETVFLGLRSYEYCRMFTTDSTTGAPRYYADYDQEHFFIAPSPGQNYAFELSYYERPTPLSATQQTSWLTQYAPQLLLNAAMVEAMSFLKRTDRVSEFQALYDRALMALVKEDSERSTDASA